MTGFRKLKKAAISITVLAMCAVLPALSGCSSTGGVHPFGGLAAGPQSTVNAWWYASFKINWPQDEEPAMDTDLLIAHTIIFPVLEQHGKEIVLWRFHRRAARDETGHRFSFIFYTTPSSARGIYSQIESSAILNQLKAEGVIQLVSMDDTNVISRPGIKDTSDNNWSVPLQKAWPYFIMGVSQTWLDLICQYAADAHSKPGSLAETQAFYRQISRKVETAWQKEGAHAFLHHLNALFGYGPVNLRGKVEMSF